VSCVIAFSTGFILRRLWIFTGTLDALLTEANQLDGIALLGKYRMTFGFMSGRPLGLVISRKSLTSVFNGHFLPLYFESFLPVFL